MHLGHARGAAYGDALARLLAWRGCSVTREFYVNDYGSQIRKLGESVRAIALGEPIPEDGYHGDYVGELVPLERARTLDLDELSREALAACLELIRGSLERFGVRFDVWFSERSLHENGAVSSALARLEQLGETYSEDGALWLRSTEARRRPRPRADPLRRAAHLLLLRHRLPRGQAFARLREALLCVGRRPSRLRAADEGCA